MKYKNVIIGTQGLRSNPEPVMGKRMWQSSTCQFIFLYSKAKIYLGECHFSSCTFAMASSCIILPIENCFGDHEFLFKNVICVGPTSLYAP